MYGAATLTAEQELRYYEIHEAPRWSRQTVERSCPDGLSTSEVQEYIAMAVGTARSPSTQSSVLPPAWS